MNGVAIFALGFAAGAVTFAAATFIASLPREQDWTSFTGELQSDEFLPDQIPPVFDPVNCGGVGVQCDPAAFSLNDDDAFDFSNLDDGKLGEGAVPVVRSHRDRPAIFLAVSN